MEKWLLKAEELAELLEVHPQTIYRLHENGKLPALRVGRLLRFSLPEVEKALRGGEGDAPYKRPAP